MIATGTGAISAASVSKDHDQCDPAAAAAASAGDVGVTGQEVAFLCSENVGTSTGSAMIPMIEDTRVKFLGHFSRAGCVRREGRNQWCVASTRGGAEAPGATTARVVKILAGDSAVCDNET